MLLNIINKKTYLIKPLRVTVIVRSMKKASDKAIGHAPKLMEALEKNAANTAVNSTDSPANPTANSSTPHPLPRTRMEEQNTQATHVPKSPTKDLVNTIKEPSFIMQNKPIQLAIKLKESQNTVVQENNLTTTTTTTSASNQPLVEKPSRTLPNFEQEKNVSDVSKIQEVNVQQALQKALARQAMKDPSRVTTTNNTSDSTGRDVSLQEDLKLAQAFGVSRVNTQSAEKTKMHEEDVKKLIHLLDENTQTTGSIVAKLTKCLHSYEEMKKGNIVFSPSDTVLFEKLKILFSDYNQKVSAYIQERNTIGNPISKEISSCYTKEDYNKEIERYRDLLARVNETIKNHQDIKHSEDDLLAILKESKIIKHPDALYFKILHEEGKDSVRVLHIEKEGEGAQIVSNAYDLLPEKENDSKADKIIPVEYQVKILAEVSTGNFKIVRIISKPEASILVESGLRKHLAITVEDPYSKDHLLIVGSLTSTKDDVTITLTRTQEDFEQDLDEDDNKEKEPDDVPKDVKDKEQRLRVPNHLVRISRTEVKEKKNSAKYLQKEATTMNETNKSLITVAEKIKQCFDDKKQMIFSREITAPQEFTVEDLLECAQLQCEEKIIELQVGETKLDVKLKKQDPSERCKNEQELEKASKTLKNQKEEHIYYNTLSRDKQLTYNIYKILGEIHAKRKEENAISARRIYVEEMKKKYAFRKTGKNLDNENTTNSKHDENT